MPRGPTLAALILAAVAIGIMGSIDCADLAASAIGLASVIVLVEQRRARQAVLLLCLLAASAADGAFARDRALASPLLLWFDAFAPDARAPDAVIIRGTLAGEASQADTGVRLLIDVDRIRVGNT